MFDIIYSYKALRSLLIFNIFRKKRMDFIVLITLLMYRSFKSENKHIRLRFKVMFFNLLNVKIKIGKFLILSFVFVDK
jgi:hypothetical protein